MRVCVSGRQQRLPDCQVLLYCESNAELRSAYFYRICYLQKLNISKRTNRRRIGERKVCRRFACISNTCRRIRTSHCARSQSHSSRLACVAAPRNNTVQLHRMCLLTCNSRCKTRLAHSHALRLYGEPTFPRVCIRPGILLLVATQYVNTAHET